MRVVDTGVRGDDWVEVLAGVSADERVIPSPLVSATALMVQAPRDEDVTSMTERKRTGRTPGRGLHQLAADAAVDLSQRSRSVVFAVIALPREEEPQIVVPMIDVFVQMPGASPIEVEQRIARPLEKLLWEVPGVEYLYSTSSTGPGARHRPFLRRRGTKRRRSYD
jgi:hypothetical protein